MPITHRSEELDPAKPEHNIARINEMSLESSSFHLRFADGSPSFTRVEFSITDLCNRRCVFCPRYDPAVYPNNDDEMSAELYEKIVSDLASLEWAGGIAFSGFGEPLLHRDLLSLVRLTKRYLPESILDIVTNGDKLSVPFSRELYEAGLDVLKVSLYDGPHQIPVYEGMRAELGVDPKRFIIRHRFDKSENYGLILSNRAGMALFPELPLKPLKEPLKQECHFPFYKLMIDYDGRVLLCSHDWGKRLIAGDLKTQSVAEVWGSKTMSFVRKRLQHKDRCFQPCSACNVDGTLNGKEAYDRWRHVD